MEFVLEILMNWWGITIAAVAVVLAFLGFDWLIEREVVEKRVRDLMFLAEEKARKGVLKTGEDKFEWVLENGYAYLPPLMKIIVSKRMFATIVQAIFDRVMGWAEEQGIQ